MRPPRAFALRLLHSLGLHLWAAWWWTNYTPAVYFYRDVACTRLRAQATLKSSTFSLPRHVHDFPGAPKADALEDDATLQTLRLVQNRRKQLRRQRFLQRLFPESSKAKDKDNGGKGKINYGNKAAKGTNANQNFLSDEDSIHNRDKEKLKQEADDIRARTSRINGVSALQVSQKLSAGASSKLSAAAATGRGSWSLFGSSTTPATMLHNGMTPLKDLLPAGNRAKIKSSTSTGTAVGLLDTTTKASTTGEQAEQDENMFSNQVLIEANPKIILMVLSGRTNWEARKALRETWLKVQKNTHPQLYKDPVDQLLFVQNPTYHGRAGGGGGPQVVLGDDKSKQTNDPQSKLENFNSKYNNKIAYFMVGARGCEVPEKMRVAKWDCTESPALMNVWDKDGTTSKAGTPASNTWQLSRQEQYKKLANEERKINATLQSEADLHGDVVLLPHVDTYFSISKKVKLSIAWLLEKDPTLDWIVISCAKVSYSYCSDAYTNLFLS